MIKEKLAKLIDLKSIITLAMTFTLIYILVGPVEVNEIVFALFNTSYGVVLGFYFAKKKEPEVTTAVVDNYEETKPNAIGFQQEEIEDRKEV